MIVDTSALIAVLLGEPHADELRTAIFRNGGSFPAPALVEFRRVTTKRMAMEAPWAEEFLADMLAHDLRIEPFTEADAMLAGDANLRYGTGNGHGGTLNLLDLMVYAVAKRTGRPILCTGKDFAATDADLHPASRRW